MSERYKEVYSPMKLKETLKKFGEKNAEAHVCPRSGARLMHEPKLPAKLQQRMDQADKSV